MNDQSAKRIASFLALFAVVATVAGLAYFSNQRRERIAKPTPPAIAVTSQPAVSQQLAIDAGQAQVPGELASTAAEQEQNLAAGQLNTQAPGTSRAGASSDAASPTTPSGISSTPRGSTPTSTATPSKPATSAQPLTPAQKVFGHPQSGLPWHSGYANVMQTNTFNTSAFAQWRGRPVDVVAPLGPQPDSQSHFDADSWWDVNLLQGFQGHLVIVTPLTDSQMSTYPADPLTDVVAGKHDQQWKTLGQELQRRGSGDVLVRLGAMPNVSFNAGALQSAPAYRQAYQRVVGLLREGAPHLKFEFLLSCDNKGDDAGLKGKKDEIFTAFYPGDDFVDVIGCSAQDFDSSVTTATSWNSFSAPTDAIGLSDVMNYARHHGKSASVGLWGVRSSVNDDAKADNPFFVRKMFEFFQANKDILAYEICDGSFGSLDYDAELQISTPQSATTYKQLWAKKQ